MMAILRFVKRYRLRVAVLVGLLVALWIGVALQAPMWGETSTDVFEEVWETVNENFFDAKFNGADWPALKQRYGAEVAQANSAEEESAAINRMLAELKTSHTRFYRPTEPEYFQLLGIFDLANRMPDQLKKFLPEGIGYVGMGAFTRDMDGDIFVRAVLDGSPAEAAGLKVGDQILAVDGGDYEAVRSFAGKAGQAVKVEVQRSPTQTETLTVTPRKLDPETMFLEAMRSSVQVIERDNHKLGYIHIWSYAGDQYQDALIEELTEKRLKDVDGLILDLREGWGGASPDYLSLFTARVPNMEFVPRNGDRRSVNKLWRKPVVMLVNQGSRSGKEVLAYGFQQYQIGPVVGSKTAGAVVGGSPFLMQDGSLLYLAVVDVFVNGDRLEGKGVVPDVEVPMTLPFAQGADPQKERAIEVLVERVKGA